MPSALTAEPLMARNFAVFVTEVWNRDSDFRKMPAGPQRTYMMLATQPDVSPCGVLAYAPGRWSRYASDTTRASIEADVEYLAERRYVALDPETDELWIRAFMKVDRAWPNPKRLPGIVSGIDQIASDMLSSMARHELQRLQSMNQGGSGGAKALQDTLFDSHPDSHPDRQGHRALTRDARNPDPDPDPKELSPPSSLRSSGSPRRAATRLPEPFVISDAMRAWARDNAPGAVPADHDAFCDYWRGVPGLKGSKLDWAATWRNWMRRESERRGGRPPSTVNGRPVSKSDARVAETLELANRLEREELEAGTRLALEGGRR